MGRHRKGPPAAPEDLAGWISRLLDKLTIQASEDPKAWILLTHVLNQAEEGWVSAATHMWQGKIKFAGRALRLEDLAALATENGRPMKKSTASNRFSPTGQAGYAKLLERKRELAAAEREERRAPAAIGAAAWRQRAAEANEQLAQVIQLQPRPEKSAEKPKRAAM